MTVLGIGAVVAITLALAGVIDSFNTTLDASRSEALAGARQRLTVDVAAPQPATAASDKDQTVVRCSIDDPPTLHFARRAKADARTVKSPKRLVHRARIWH